jgi:hypothetical protein
MEMRLLKLGFGLYFLIVRLKRKTQLGFDC